jgi:hypothetical protein
LITHFLKRFIMAVSKTPAIEIRDSKVFQVPLPTGTLTIVLLTGDLNTTAMTDCTLTWTLTVPAMMCRLPNNAWRMLWPDKKEPPGWMSVRSHHNSIIAEPVRSQSTVGGVVAYISPDKRIPINGKTIITIFGTGNEQLSRSEQILWDALLQEITPRVPYSRLTNKTEFPYYSPTPLMYTPELSKSGSYMTPALRRRAPRYKASFLSGGIITAVLVGVIIWFTVQHQMKKTLN